MSMNPELPENCTLKTARHDELTDAQYDEHAALIRAACSEYVSDGINLRGVAVDDGGLHEELARNSETAFIVYENGTPVAYARGYLHSYRGATFLSCKGVAVHPNCRRSGYGRIVAAKREEWAKAQGAAYAMLGTATTAEKAKAFHHRNGYKDWRYAHVWGRTYYSIFMRKDYGEPYPTLPRLARLYASWVITHLTYSKRGGKRPLFYVKGMLKKLLRRG